MKIGGKQPTRIPSDGYVLTVLLRDILFSVFWDIGEFHLASIVRELLKGRYPWELQQYTIYECTQRKTEGASKEIKRSCDALLIVFFLFLIEVKLLFIHSLLWNLNVNKFTHVNYLMLNNLVPALRRQLAEAVDTTTTSNKSECHPFSPKCSPHMGIQWNVGQWFPLLGLK